MDIAADVSASLNAASQGDAVSTAVLRKTLDIQQQNAAQLLEAVPDVGRPAAGSSSQESLGRNIDVSA